MSVHPPLRDSAAVIADPMIEEGICRTIPLRVSPRAQ